MSDTSPQPNATPDPDEIARVRGVVASRGLAGAANDTKWGRLLDAMRQRSAWCPSFRYKCVDGPASNWDTEWWYHVPLPMISVEWLDISLTQPVQRGMLLESESIDHSAWIVTLLDECRFCYDMVGDVIRIHGYLPKSFDLLEDRNTCG